MQSYILDKLTKLYPTLEIDKLSSKYTGLYLLVASSAKEKGTTIKEYIEELGFKYNRRRRTYPFDIETAKLLIEEYDISQVQIAKWLGVTRQAIFERLSGKSSGSWVTTNITLEEQAVVLDMIEKQLFTIETDQLIVTIRTNYKKISIIIINEDQIKVLFEFPNAIEMALNKTNLNVLTQIDFEIRDCLQPVNIIGVTYARTNSKTRSKIRQQCRKRSISEEEYCKLHGFAGIADGRTRTDFEIEEIIISNYVTEKNFVYFPHEAEHYNSFLQRAHRSNMTIDEFFEFYGFIKMDSRLNSTYESKIEEYKEEIRRYLIVGSNKKVLIKSDSPLYRRLYSFAKRRDITLDDLLQDLGFERVFSNDNYVSFSTSFEKKLINNKDLILTELENLQGEFERESTPGAKIKRNKQMVKKLKELYSYRCQLCSKENSIPLIKKEDGTFYVEVHHIKALSTASLLKNDEHIFDDMLDHYLNAIVVCPFHHKVLHYHDGGFERMVQQETDLFFISRKDTLLKVEVNFHLNEKR